MTKTNIYEDIIKGIKEGNIDRENLENKKLEFCSDYSASKVPKNSDVLEYANKIGERDNVKHILRKAPIRSSSGVTPVSVMTHPVSVCPHGRCLFCPVGEDSKFEDSQLSYPGGPCVRRARRNNYDPYDQVMDRLVQLYENGHDIDKSELIIKSATITSRSHDYQVWFVKRCLEAMNDFNKSEENRNRVESYKDIPQFKYLNNVISENETSDVRCIGITFETKPDWCEKKQIDRMLGLGVTKVEIGVQTTFDKINKDMNRGHDINDSIKANKNLRDSGMKVGFHMMPGLPGMDRDMILNDFDEIFENENLRPDYLKIYPSLVIEGTVVYDMWKEGEYNPLSSEEAADIIADIKDKIPKYVRLQRVQRDIPANQIEAGVKKSNLRQIAKKKMDKDQNCDCIRCREIGLNDADNVDKETIKLDIIEYECCGGTEKFISYEDDKGNLIGFARLRFPDSSHREELNNSSILRELHVYGQQVSLGESKDKWQHKGYGKKLVKKAEEISKENGYNEMNIISGIGVREYYKNKLGYNQNGPYVNKRLK